MIKSRVKIVLFLLSVSFILSGTTITKTSPEKDPLKARMISIKKQAKIRNESLLWKLDNLLPVLMRKEGIDMWLLMNRENNEDPLYLTMVPQPNMTARRRFLLFYDRGEEKGVERLDGTGSGTGTYYKGMKSDPDKDRFDNLISAIKKRNPKKIAINTSENWAHADGISATLKDRLTKALGPEYKGRLVSAEKLCVGWLGTRSPIEIKIYPHICSVAHQIIREFFSNKVITPGVTTTEQVRWWARQRMNDLGLQTWFHPDIFLTRYLKHPPEIDHRSSFSKYYIDPDNPEGTVIQRGDLLHCDFGIIYMGLCTDMQWEAYVLKEGETSAPDGILKAHKKARRMAEIYMGEFKEGRRGSEIAFSALRKGKKEGLSAYIYSHPVGFHGHAAGVNPGGRDSLEKLPPAESNHDRYPLHFNTTYAIEFQIITAIPEWGGQKIRWGFEEDAIFTREGCRFIDGHENELILIR